MLPITATLVHCHITYPSLAAHLMRVFEYDSLIVSSSGLLNAFNPGQCQLLQGVQHSYPPRFRLPSFKAPDCRETAPSGPASLPKKAQLYVFLLPQPPSTTITPISVLPTICSCTAIATAIESSSFLEGRPDPSHRSYRQQQRPYYYHPLPTLLAVLPKYDSLPGDSAASSTMMASFRALQNIARS